MTEFYEERLSRRPKNLSELPIIRKPETGIPASEQIQSLSNTCLSPKHLEALGFMMGR